MRTHLITAFACLSLGLGAAPLHAETSPDATIIAEQLNDPEFQQELSASMTAMMQIMLELPIGRMAHAMDGAMSDALPDEAGAAMRDIPADATLGELARAKDPDFEEKFAAKAEAMPEMMGALASGFAAMMPELLAMGERMKERYRIDR